VSCNERGAEPTKPTKKKKETAAVVTPKARPKPAKPAKPAKVRADELIASAAATVKCEGLPEKRDELEKLAEKGGACAMARLGWEYLDGNGGTVEQGMRLVRSAWAKGAAVGITGCLAFEEGIGAKPDRALALRCLLRAEDWTWAAVMVANGDGVKRDLELAAAILARDQSGGPCGDGVKEALAARRKAASPKRLSHCEICPDNNVNGFLCGDMDSLRRAFRAERSVRPLLARVPPGARDALVALRKATARYAGDESNKVYVEYQDGSARGSFSELRKQLINAHFADDLKQLLDGKLPAVTQAEKTRLDRALALALRRDEREPGSRSWRKSLRRAQKSWIALRGAWERFANEASPSARDAIRARLTVERIYQLTWSPATNDKTHLEELEQALVKARIGSADEARQIHKQLLAVDAFERNLTK
jgi:hypothetical protein